MSKIKFDQDGQRTYETGVSECVLFLRDDSGAYVNGVAWNGITKVGEAPSGAEGTAIYADNIKYLNLVSAEEFAASIEAYTYPDEFAECDGSLELVPGVTIGQQDRTMFGIAYKTVLGNDVQSNRYGYKLHIVYGCLAAPSNKDYSTINDSPEAISFSWEVKTTPVAVKDHKPTATIVINSTKVDKEKLEELEDIIYGSEDSEPRLPLPDEIATIIGGTI